MYFLFWLWLFPKIVLVGDSFAGKTSVVYRMVNSDRVLPEYIPTVMKTEPVRFVNQRGSQKSIITFSVVVDGENMEFMVWDTAGQEDYDRLYSLWLLSFLNHFFHKIRLRPLAYPGTDVVVMLCSKSSYTTLLNLKYDSQLKASNK